MLAKIYPYFEKKYELTIIVYYWEEKMFSFLTLDLMIYLLIVFLLVIISKSEGEKQAVGGYHFN